MANVTNIPAPRVPFIDERTGLMSREWYRFFMNMFVLVGSGTNDISLADVQVSPDSRDLSGDFTELLHQSRLSVLPAAIPQDRTKTDANMVMEWLSIQ